MQPLRERLGIDLGRKMTIEAAIEWAARHGVRFVQVEIDTDPRGIASFDARRCAAVRSLATTSGVQVSLHTLSAVNVAEYAPFVAEAADAYLEAYADIAARLGASDVIVHAGYHFTADRDKRMQAACERLKRVAHHAERAGTTLLLENLNKEPDEAEVHYLAHDLAEFMYLLDRIDSPAVGCSFTVNHAHLVPEGIDGFLDAMPLARLQEVRLADNLGDREVHLMPGEGNIDFAHLFRRLDDAGYRGRYMCNFGSADDMLRGREILAGAHGA